MNILYFLFTGSIQTTDEGLCKVLYVENSGSIICPNGNSIDSTKGMNVYILTTPGNQPPADHPPWNFDSRWCSVDQANEKLSYSNAEIACTNRGQVLMSINNQAQSDLFYVRPL